MKLFKNKNFIKIFVLLNAFLLAVPVLAAGAVNCTDKSSQIQNLHTFFSCWVIGNMLKYIPDLILVALVVFLAGVVKFVASGDNEESRQAGRQVMIYGIIILFVMISVNGIVALIYHSFFPGQTIYLPDQLPRLQGSNITQ